MLFIISMQVRAVFDNTLGKITKAKIIELYLKKLLDEKYIEKIGSARTIGYKKKQIDFKSNLDNQ